MLLGKVDGASPPVDPSDFGRCFRLLELIPRWRKRMPEMAAIGGGWEALVPVWGELEALYREELPSRRAPKLYQRMSDLLDGARRARGVAFARGPVTVASESNGGEPKGGSHG